MPHELQLKGANSIKTEAKCPLAAIAANVNRICAQLTLLCR